MHYRKTPKTTSVDSKLRFEKRNRDRRKRREQEAKQFQAKAAAPKPPAAQKTLPLGNRKPAPKPRATAQPNWRAKLAAAIRYNCGTVLTQLEVVDLVREFDAMVTVLTPQHSKDDNS